jgi:hypothetical protein
VENVRIEIGAVSAAPETEPWPSGVDGAAKDELMRISFHGTDS